MADDTDTAAFVQSLKNDNTVRKTTSDMRLFTKWLKCNNEMRLAEEIPVTELDKCLARLFMTGNPQSLVRTVWMNNTLHFGLRSREEHTTLRWGDIQMKATTDGQQYLEHTERITKTRNGANLDTRAFQAKMFADTGNIRCPIQTYKQFLRRRPDDMVADDCPSYLGFSRQTKDDGVWFSRQA
ncbi:unnamed protein product [Mytilus edulis]|uniref:ZMYM2-like/QRICH1 C-terminal domain-containing protein n=1 Tax=Mytilus edulis TaxID=6550 RepID=A0A8S3V9T9_MYTED|nr:unnamed protein product [Mytilus edulis]